MKLKVLILLFCVAFQCGGIIMRGSGGAPAPVVFTTDCTTLAGWTNVSSGTGSTDIATVPGICGTQSTSGEDMEYIQGPTAGIDNFASMQVVDTRNGGGRASGFVLRAQASPGNHYDCVFSNGGTDFEFRSMAGHTESDVVSGVTDCGCIWQYVFDGNYIGCRVTGTGSSTAASFWNFGSSPPDDDPANWGAATCECSAAEINAVPFTRVDTPGSVGWHQYKTATGCCEPEFDNVRAGDS